MNTRVTQEHLQAIALGDETVFRTVFYENKDRVYTYLLKVLQSVEMAEDGVQEIFLKLWKERNRLTAINNFDAYFHRMVKNYAFSCFRSMARKVRSKNKMPETETTPFCPDEILMHKEAARHYQHLLASLSPQQRSVFLLSREDGFKHEEIAQHLGINVLTVKKHMTLALRVLREKMLTGLILFLMFLVK